MPREIMIAVDDPRYSKTAADYAVDIYRNSESQIKTSVFIPKPTFNQSTLP